MLALHLALIYTALKFQPKQPISVDKSGPAILKVLTERHEVSVLSLPPISQKNSQSNFLKLESPSKLTFESTYSNPEGSDKPYEFVDPGSAQYQHLFDPRLREKLKSVKHFSKSKNRSVDGIEISDMGDGTCMLTSLSSQQSGNSAGPGWVVVKCGNNESEQMIENMEKSLSDPLGLKK